MSRDTPRGGEREYRKRRGSRKRPKNSTKETTNSPTTAVRSKPSHRSASLSHSTAQIKVLQRAESLPHLSLSLSPTPPTPSLSLSLLPCFLPPPSIFPVFNSNFHSGFLFRIFWTKVVAEEDERDGGRGDNRFGGDA